MANIPSFLTNNNLKTLIESLKIEKEQKDLLISKLSQLDGEERLKLLEVLKDVCLLDIEEEAAIKKIKESIL